MHQKQRLLSPTRPMQPTRKLAADLQRYTSEMIKLIAIIIFFIIFFALKSLMERKYPQFKKLKVNFFKRYLHGLFLGVLFGSAGGFKIVFYPEFDKNFDLYLVLGLVLFLIINESIDLLILNGKGSWFLSTKEKV